MNLMEKSGYERGFGRLDETGPGAEILFDEAVERRVDLHARTFAMNDRSPPRGGPRDEVCYSPGAVHEWSAVLRNDEEIR
jgi:hypothetical protein